MSSQGRQVLFLPPLRRAVVDRMPGPTGRPLTTLVAPRDVPAAVVARLKPENLVLYGSQTPAANLNTRSPLPTYLTQQGAVNLTITREGATLEQFCP